MRTAGYFLILIGIVSAAIVKHFVPSLEYVLPAFALPILGGMVLVIIDATFRLSRQQIQLRPVEAIKYSIPMFFVFLILFWLANLAFGDSPFDLWMSVVTSAVAAALFGLHSTAYRKPE